ncbi:nucleoside-triphosphatase [Caloramator sp. Dgby_cultured_2]|uniref:nucleoside-triphosphatase n=1 Tax=Caloramator sp. Dgby_cultured_2 TaxID=3029174 RepID=UPI00406C73A2
MGDGDEEYFLTGEKGIGKSTLLFKILNLLDCSIGGYYEKRLHVKMESSLI